MTELGQWAYIVLYVLPVSAILFFVFKKLWPLSLSGRIALLVLLPATITFPLWDVYMIGQKATRLCNEEGGLHVYQTVEADSFFGASNIDYYSKFGFLFTESSSRGSVYRSVMKDEKPHHIRIEMDDVISKYEVGIYKATVSDRITRYTDNVHSRYSDSILGEQVNFTIYPGIMDSLFISIMPVTFTPWMCGNNDIDIVQATLKPKGLRK